MCTNRNYLILGSIRFNEEKDLIVVRCIYLLSEPFKDKRGTSIIQFLLNYGFHDLPDSDKELWTKHTDVLISFLNCMFTSLYSISII